MFFQHKIPAFGIFMTNLGLNSDSDIDPYLRIVQVEEINYNFIYKVKEISKFSKNQTINFKFDN